MSLKVMACAVDSESHVGTATDKRNRILGILEFYDIWRNASLVHKAGVEGNS